MKNKHARFRQGGLAAAVAVCIAGGALGQTAVEEVIVTGSKTNRAVGDLTQAVSVIGELEIQSQAYVNLTEVLRNEAGIEFKAVGTPGQFNYPKMRGFATGHILVVIDGMKINDGSSGGVGNLLGQIDPDTIERIEILRGPQATLYGSNSTAGVLSITTKSGQQDQLGVRAESGSMSYRSLGLSARGSAPAGASELIYSLNLDDTDSDGVNPLEYTENQSVQGKLELRGETFSVGGGVWQTDNDFGYAELDEAAGGLASRAEHWAFQTPDPNSRSATKERIVNAFVDYRFNDTWSNRVMIGHNDKTVYNEDLDDGLLGYVAAPFNDFVDFSCDYSTVYQAGEQVPVCDSAYVATIEDTNRQVDYNLNYVGDRLDAVFGLEYYDQDTRTDDYAGGQDVSSVYFNGGINLDQAGRTILSLGARYDDFSSWGGETTGSIGLGHDLTDNVNLFVNYGTSFSSPSVSHLYSAYGNTALTPEEGDTFELGARANLERLGGAITFWHTKLENVIAYDGSIPNPRVSWGFGQYVNRDEQTTQGVEVEADYLLTELLSLVGSYTYTDSESRQGDTVFRTVQIADNKGSLGLRYQSDRLSASVNAYYSGPRLRWAGDVEMKSYTRIDLSGSYSLTDALRFYGRVENLFDTNIEEGLGYAQPGTYGVVGLEYRM